MTGLSGGGSRVWGAGGQGDKVGVVVGHNRPNFSVAFKIAPVQAPVQAPVPQRESSADAVRKQLAGIASGEGF